MAEPTVESDSSRTEEANMRPSADGAHHDSDMARMMACHECPEADAMREAHPSAQSATPATSAAESPEPPTELAVAEQHAPEAEQTVDPQQTVIKLEVVESEQAAAESEQTATAVTSDGGQTPLRRRPGTVQFDASVVNSGASTSGGGGSVGGAGGLPGPPAGKRPRPRLHSSSSRPSLVDKLRGMNLSFAGCGFLGVYHIGAAACINRYCPELLKTRISGASAGAIAAAALLCETSLGTIMFDLVRVADQIQKRIGGPFSPFVSVPNLLQQGLRKNLPDNAHELCTDRLHISVTRLRDGHNCILSEFETKEELIAALMCTAFIPVFSGCDPPLFRGERYMDGCYSNNLPTLDTNTLTVSPFCGEADICPRDANLSLIVVNIANTPVELTRENMMRTFSIMTPPPPETLSELANQGFNDAIRFLVRHDLIKCQICVLSTEIVGRAYSGCGQLITHEHKCDTCTIKQEFAKIDRLPAHVHRPLSENIMMARRRAREVQSWLLNFPGARYIVLLALPCAITYKAVHSLYRRLVRRMPQYAHMSEDVTSDVRRFVENGFCWEPKPRRRRRRPSLHARYTCRVNVVEYGDAAGQERHEEPEASQAQAEQDGLHRAAPGRVRSYDREFRVDFTKRGHATVVRSASDAERLENQVIMAGAQAAACPGIHVVEPEPQTEEQNMDRDVINMAMMDSQGQADCGVSWHFCDSDGNVRITHLSAVQTPVMTPSMSRRASVGDELPGAARRELAEESIIQALMRITAPKKDGSPAESGATAGAGARYSRLTIPQLAVSSRPPWVHEAVAPELGGSTPAEKVHAQATPELGQSGAVEVPEQVSKQGGSKVVAEVHHEAVPEEPLTGSGPPHEKAAAAPADSRVGESVHEATPNQIKITAEVHATASIGQASLVGAEPEATSSRGEPAGTGMVQDMAVSQGEPNKAEPVIEPAADQDERREVETANAAVADDSGEPAATGPRSEPTATDNAQA